MKKNTTMDQPMYENMEDQENFVQTLEQHENFIDKAIRYFEAAGVDTEEEELYEYFELDIYPFEEFEKDMPPADKLKFGGDFPQDPDYKVFYLNIKYANLADRLIAYQLLEKYGIDWYPVYIVDNRHLRSYYIHQGPDQEVEAILERIKTKTIGKEELDALLWQKRKQDHLPKEAFTWILNEQEEDILAITSDDWVYFGHYYQYDIKVSPKSNVR